MMHKKNKRGDIPVTILVIGVFVVCTLAILSFINSNLSISKTFVGTDLMEKANIDIERNQLTNYYIDYNVTKITPEFGFDWFNKKTIFSVQYTDNP